MFVRFFEEDDALNSLVKAAVLKARGKQAVLCFTPQVARESWAVLTRPQSAGGYNMRPAEAAALLESAHTVFDYIPDTPAIYEEWRRLITLHGVSGRQVHDAYHAAAMIVHGFSEVLTLDNRDFKRYAEITVIHPENL